MNKIDIIIITVVILWTLFVTMGAWKNFKWIMGIRKKIEEKKNKCAK